MAYVSHSSGGAVNVGPAVQVQGYILGTLMRGDRMLSVYSLLRQDTVNKLNKFTSEVAFSQAPLSALLYDGERYVCLSSFTVQSCNCLVAGQTPQTFLFSLTCFICFALVSLFVRHLCHSTKTSLFAPSSMFASLKLQLFFFPQHLFFTMSLSSNCIPSFIQSHESAHQVTCLSFIIIASPFARWNSPAALEYQLEFSECKLHAGLIASSPQVYLIHVSSYVWESFNRKCICVSRWTGEASWHFNLRCLGFMGHSSWPSFCLQL